MNKKNKQQPLVFISDGWTKEGEKTGSDMILE